MAKWAIELDDLPQGGFAPNYFRENYPRYGDRNQAGAMVAMDLTNSGYIQPGPKMEIYPGGISVVTKTIKSVVKDVISQVAAYGGGNKYIYKLEGGLSASLLHTISATTASSFDIHSFKYFRSNYYYTWVDGNDYVDIGAFNGTASFNDKWWSNTLSATVLQTDYNNEYVIEIGGNDVMYIANGRYVASYDGTTAQDKALDLPVNSTIKDIHWMNDRLYIPAKKSIHGHIGSSLYLWDGTTDSWETEIPINGIVAAGYVKNGMYFQFYYSNDGTSKLSILEGNRIIDLVSFNAEYSLPQYYQVTEYKDYLIWISPNNFTDIFAYGPLDNKSTPKLFHIGNTPSTADGTISNALITKGLLVGSANQLHYLDTFSPYTYGTASSWKSLMFDIAGDRQNGGQINSIRFNFEKLVSGAVLDWSLVNSQGTTIYSDKISYAKATASNPLHTLTTAYYPLNGKVTEDFRVELNYANGSTTAPVRVKNIKLYGEG